VRWVVALESFGAVSRVACVTGVSICRRRFLPRHLQNAQAGPGPGLGELARERSSPFNRRERTTNCAERHNKNMELIGPIEFRLRLIERNDLA